MKKISFKLIINILSLVVVSLKGVLAMAKKICDVIDNGKADGSFEAPVWMMNIEAGLEYAQRTLTCFEAASSLALQDSKLYLDPENPGDHDDNTEQS